MKLLLFANLACLLGLSLAEFAPFSDEQINYINSIQTSWTARRHFEPSQYTFAKRLLGTDLDQNALYNQLHPAPIKTNVTVENLPKSFDAREQWPDCVSIKEVRDQGDCGSCWAVTSAATISDRICVATKDNVRISEQDIVTCCKESCGFACDGGFLLAALNWFVSDGVVTGGPYGSNSGCMPYLYPDNGKMISDTNRPSTECTSACIDEYDLTYPEDKHFGAESFHVTGVEAIMSEIYNNGPVAAGFIVFEDFMNYKSGVYRHVIGRPLGGHAVKIIGWGVENGRDYWLAVNTWNTDWGENGLFRIAKGINEAQIEYWIAAVSVAV